MKAKGKEEKDGIKEGRKEDKMRNRWRECFLTVLDFSPRTSRVRDLNRGVLLH